MFRLIEKMTGNNVTETRELKTSDSLLTLVVIMLDHVAEVSAFMLSVQHNPTIERSETHVKISVRCTCGDCVEYVVRNKHNGDVTAAEFNAAALSAANALRSKIVAKAKQIVAELAAMDSDDMMKTDSQSETMRRSRPSRN